MAAQTKTGMLNINDFAINYLCQSLPFGGVKASGFGRFAGVEGLRDECTLKSVTSDKVSWMKTRIPAVLGYPASERGTKVCVALSWIVYGQGVAQKWDGLKQMIKAFM